MPTDFKKAFKTPRYTGVSLSLLSLFVLASMLVVWEKVSQVNSVSSIDPIVVWAEDSLKPTLQMIKNGYENEIHEEVDLRFFSNNDQTSLNFLLEKPIDLIIGSEFNFSEPNLVERSVGEKIPVAFKPVSPGLSQSKTQRLVKASVWKKSSQPEKAIRFARFLASPSRGQFYLAQKNWVGVDGDIWAASPKIKVLCDLKIQSLIRTRLLSFHQREGIYEETEFKDTEQIEHTINIVTMSKAKEYLPDLIVSGKILNLDPVIYQLSPLSTETFNSYLFMGGKYKQTCKRLISYLSVTNIDMSD